MPKIHYSQVIIEDPEELKELEKYHRYTHLFQRLHMLRLLKSEECRNLGEAARALGYSWRQCQRWFDSYQQGGLEELLKSRVSERGRQELVTPEAFEDLEEAMKRGEIATISQADEFLRERHGIEYAHPDGVGQLLRRRRKVKLKTGRPRHEKADQKEQEAFEKNFAGEIKKIKERRCEKGKPLKVMAFDEARFGLINWHRRRYCPEGFRPPWVVKRSYKWTYLYAAVEPTSGESFCLYLPGMDEGCLKIFLEELSKTYPDHHLLVVLDGAPSHRSKQIEHPENISLLMLPPYSPELDPAERWFEEFRRKLSNRTFESVALLQEALSQELWPYWEEPALLKRLTGYPWWEEAVEKAEEKDL